MSFRAAVAALAVTSLAVAVAILIASWHGAAPLHVLGMRIRFGDASRPLWAAAALSAALFPLATTARLRVLSLVLLAATGAIAVLALARAADPTPPVGDVGVIEVYVFEALRGRLFLGPYSRFLWHHPGPIYFFLLVPFYVLSGYKTAGIAAGALFINAGSVGVMVWVARRYGGVRAACLLAIACAGFALRFPALLTSQWNPHVLVFPTLACVVLAAAVATGAAALIPVLIAFASFAAQTHLGLVPTVSAVTACALIGARVASAGAGIRRFWWHVNAGLWVAAGLWLLPVVQEITASPGNLTRLARFFASGSTGGQTLTTSFAAWAGALTGAFRPAFALAWGGEVQRTASAVAVGAALVLLVLVAVSVAIRRQRPFLRALAALTAVASVVAFWSVTRIAGEIVDHEVFWMSGLGVLGLAIVCEAVMARAAASMTFSEKPPDPFPAGRARLDPARLVDTLSVAALVVLFGAGGLDLRHRVTASAEPGSEELAAGTLADGIIAYARSEHVPRLLITIDSGVWGVAAGVLVELDRAGVRYGVDPGAVWMFGDAAAPDGTESRTIRISGYGGHGEALEGAGVKPLAARRGFFADLVRR